MSLVLKDELVKERRLKGVFIRYGGMFGISRDTRRVRKIRRN